MTKSTITRERLQEIAEDGFLKHGESKELARMALAAMDSEPVAYAWVSRSGKKHLTRCEPEQWRDAVIVTPLYRHAQPAPVVPDEVSWEDVPEEITDDNMEVALAWAHGFNQCRAAMLQAQSDDDGEPTDDERIMAIEGIHNCERCGDEGWVAGEMGITRCACSQGGTLTSEDTKQFEPVTTANKLGNSPVIPDGSEDTKRLNWLDAQNKRLNEYYGTSYGWKFDANFQRNAMMLNDSNYPVMTVRQAIDEAIAAAPQLPSSEPATVPGKWIPVSEQMPPSRHEVLVGRWWGEKPRWCCKWATYIPGHPDAQSSGWLIPGASWTPTHWMELPAAPQEVNHG